MFKVTGPLLEFEFRQQVIQKEPCIVLQVGDALRSDACRWRECACRYEVAAALRRLADRLEGKL